jgi:hypothetical protein
MKCLRGAAATLHKSLIALQMVLMLENVEYR